MIILLNHCYISKSGFTFKRKYYEFQTQCSIFKHKCVEKIKFTTISQLSSTSILGDKGRIHFTRKLL